MAYNVYTPAELIGVVESLENEPITFFRDRYYPFELFSDKEEVYFDVVDKHRRLAPYVSPLHQGKMVESAGYSTRMIKPPYVKPKSIIDPNQLLKRRAGEALNGELSPAERRDLRIRQVLQEHEEMLQMLEEVQCAEFLRTGQITITGEGYGTLVLQFGRASGLTKTLLGTDQWDDASQSGKTLGQLEDWALEVRQAGGGIVRDITMDPDAWAAFKNNLTDKQMQMLFDSLRGSQSRAELGPRLAEKVRYEGRIGDFDFWTYSDTYQNENGSEVKIMPSGTVVMSSSALEGTRCYGAIRDLQVMRSLRMFSKMWEQQDPSVEYLLSQSAPLMVPLRPNALLGATVL